MFSDKSFKTYLFIALVVAFGVLIYGIDIQSSILSEEDIIRDEEQFFKQELVKTYEYKLPSEKLQTATTVCTVSRNPRQGSIFRTNLMALIGSGKYTYNIVSQYKDCPKEQPRVKTISYVKCCSDLRKTNRTVTSAMKTYDVVVVTGDEYCKMKHAQGQFRQYFGTDIIGNGKEVTIRGRNVKLPLYFPLGPRSEFKRVDSTEITLLNQRKFDFNFLGSLTSSSRKSLMKVVTENELITKNFTSFLHFADRWVANLNTESYVNPAKYRDVLLDSKFTLCPSGHNPEAFRIYEACEAGSVPILVTDTVYLEHKCDNAYEPYLRSGAPFVLLETWEELPNFLNHAMRNETYLRTLQLDVMKWHKRFMSEVVLDFEALLEQRHIERMKKYN